MKLIYGLEQLIDRDGPNRVTETSSIFIELCLTNTLTAVVNSGAKHLSISDH